MKVFLSWSGEMSHKVANVFRDWLPYVIQSVTPFISSDDIDKGERWSDAIADELDNTQYGIICLTPYNTNSPWLNFEAGALSKALKQSNVSPFLFRPTAPLSQGPLQQFQLTTYDKEDIFHLMTSINNRLGDTQKLSNELLRKTYEVWWPQLQLGLDNITDSQESETQTGFPWLYTDDDLIRIQTNENFKEVWIITPNLLKRTLDPKIKTVLEKNLNRGVVYTFIIPDSSDNDSTMEELNSITLSKKDQVHLKNIVDQDFYDLAITEYIILNPNFDEEFALHVYLEMPNTSRGYWIEVDIQAAMDLVSRFRKFAQN